MITKINSKINMKQNNQRESVTFSVPVTMLPEGERNYTLFNQNKVDFFVAQGKNALPYVKNVLETSEDEGEIVEALYITDRLLDKRTKGIPRMYPILAKFNDTKSPNIQVFLAGVYRKTQVPDAFGPLVSMLIKNSINAEKSPSPKSEISNLPQGEGDSSHLSPLTSHPFNPNEEIGGAILEYIKNYSNNPKPIDYSA